MEDLPEVETITPQEAGKKLHIGAESVRAGLRQGKFPFRYSNTKQDRKLDLSNLQKEILRICQRKQLKGVGANEKETN